VKLRRTKVRTVPEVGWASKKTMNETQITKVAAVLSEWNPLGNKAHDIPDLDGYRIEAIDIIATFHSPFVGATDRSTVMTVLNQAFDLSLSEKDCAEPARKIALILKQHRK
jgi:hypothetical protein